MGNASTYRRRSAGVSRYYLRGQRGAMPIGARRTTGAGLQASTTVEDATECSALPFPSFAAFAGAWVGGGGAMM